MRIILSVCPLGHGAFSGKEGWETGSIGCFFPLLSGQGWFAVLLPYPVGVRFVFH